MASFKRCFPQNPGKFCTLINNVRASSPKRAELTGARVEIDVFGGKSVTAQARLGIH